MTSEPGSRGRRTARVRGDDRQRAIVETLERLLEDRTLTDIAVDDIAAGAAISRPTFYFYFASKQAVLLELLDRLVAEVDEGLAAVTAADADPREGWREAIAVFVDVFGRHRAAATALAEARASSPELRAVWAENSARWVDRTAAAIRAEQRRGTLPADVDPEGTSIALAAMNERVITASLARETPSIPQERVLEVLTAVWTAALRLQA